MKPAKCNAKDPATCKFHGKRHIAYQEAQKQLERRLASERREREKTERLKLSIGFDIDQNLKPKVLPTGETIVSIYRSGDPTPPTERGVEADSYLKADSYAPEGRQGRTTAVFASPTLGGAARWVKGRHFTKEDDVKVRELRVDYDKTYVYYIPTWERFSSIEGMGYGPDKVKEAGEKYWNTGMTLREWVNTYKDDPQHYDPREWEILIPREEIQAVKPVSTKRTTTFTYGSDYDKKEIAEILK